MCGIAGILRFDGAPVSLHAIQTILDKISHRGADQNGIALGSRHTRDKAQMTQAAEIGFGHRRLSILDLHPAGAQPMVYAENKLSITYNGEIYNYLELKEWLTKKSYTFKTTTDTEVLLAAYDYWGKACVKFLNGMFAFAIWDDRKKELFCARDPVGIKPFYYIKTPEYFAFASESLALTHLTARELSPAAVTSYLLSMYVATKQSIFSGIEKLAPGYTLTFDPEGKSVTECFWSLENFETMSDSDANLENLRSLIDRSVKRQLNSDVPVGGFLSGGVDSGLLTALAAPQIKNYHTYSVGYEGMANSELAHAKQLANRYSTAHTEATITAGNALGLLDKALTSLSEPVADPAIVATYLLSQLAAQDGVKVLLNGTGGDEIFAGYTRYSGQLSVKRKLLSRIPRSMQSGLASLPIHLKLKLRLQSPALDMLFSTGGSYQLAEQFANDQFEILLRELGAGFATKNPDINLLYQKMLFDLQVYLPDQLLFLLDQITMAHTLEGRVPLLDVDIIKFSYHFSARQHVANGQTKAILKKIAAPILGLEAVRRKKQGFAGSSYWWVKHNYPQFSAVIAELKHIPYFENFTLEPLLRLKTITPSQANQIFILYCFTKWYARVKEISL
jgi:asparagine synthase (glutamine-hydrolysing)